MTLQQFLVWCDTQWQSIMMMKMMLMAILKMLMWGSLRIGGRVQANLVPHPASSLPDHFLSTTITVTVSFIISIIIVITVSVSISITITISTL